MIHGIGTDIVSVSRLVQLYERYGHRFARRILSDEEYLEFEKLNHPEHFLAKRFAVKEAASKALGTGFRDGLSLKHIAVTHDALGKPQLVFHGYAKQLQTELNIGDMHLTISDEESYAVAFVVLMKAVN